MIVLTWKEAKQEPDDVCPGRRWHDEQDRECWICELSGVHHLFVGLGRRSCFSGTLEECKRFAQRAVNGREHVPPPEEP